MKNELFYEDWDGLTILQEVSKFKDETDFMEKARKYIKSTRGYAVFVLRPIIINIVISDNDNDWIFEECAKEQNFLGTTITVYKSELERENYEG